MREGTREDFDRFCAYSKHIRYVRTRCGIFPDEVLEDYMRLFPDRPILPCVLSISILMDSPGNLRHLLRSSTPAKDNPSASASPLRNLSIYRTGRSELLGENESLARDLVAFQRSNSKLGGGLDAFLDYLPFPERGRWCYCPAGAAFQESMENAFVLPPPETEDAPVHGLRHLAVTHYLHEFPDFFRRVARMRALEHLRIAIAHEDGLGETEEPIIAQCPINEGIPHSASTLEIEGQWGQLPIAVNLCAPPSAAIQFRTISLFYYLTDLPPTRATADQLLDLPEDIIPPDHLEALIIDMLDNGEDIPNSVDGGFEAALKVDALRPLLRYRQMAKLHLELPFNILLDLNILYALAAVMGETLKHFVILRRLGQDYEDPFNPGLTADNLPTIVGTVLPRLETLGLDVIYNEILASFKWDPSVASSLLQTLYVGETILSDAQIPLVARFLKENFPGLQYLYHHESSRNPWPRIVELNEYHDGDKGRWLGPSWGR